MSECFLAFIKNDLMLVEIQLLHFGLHICGICTVHVNPKSAWKISDIQLLFHVPPK